MRRSYSREELESMKVKELRELCKSYGIKVYTHKKALTKGEMVGRLITVTNIEGAEYKKEDKDKDMNVVTRNSSWETETDKKSREHVVDHSNRKRNFDYDRMGIGCFVAFRYSDYKKADTARVYAVNRKERLIKVETKCGTKYLVPFERIVWVKFHKEELWPKRVLMELKGHDRCSWEGVDGEPYGESKRSCKKIISG